MPIVTFTAEDVKRGKIVIPQWYLMTIKSVTRELSKDKSSHNWIVDLVGNSGEATDVPFRRYYSEKALGMMIPLVVSVGGTVNEETGGSFNSEAMQGKQVEAFVKNELDDKGKLRNSIEDFRPVGSGS